MIGAASGLGWGQQDEKTASFSELSLESKNVSPGQTATLKVVLHNNSSQDWPSQTHSVLVVVAQGKNPLRKTAPIAIKKDIPAGGSKDLSLRVAVPEGVSGEISFYVLLLLQNDQLVARSEPLLATTAAPAFFSDLSCATDSGSSGPTAALRAVIHNASPQAWRAKTRNIIVAVTQAGKLLRTTEPMPIKKTIPADGSKDLSLNVTMPDPGAGKVSFEIFLMQDDKIVARSGPVPAKATLPRIEPKAPAIAEAQSPKPQPQAQPQPVSQSIVPKPKQPSPSDDRQLLILEAGAYE
jgi:hypothetical protein